MLEFLRGRWFSDFRVLGHIGIEDSSFSSLSISLPGLINLLNLKSYMSHSLNSLKGVL